MIDLIANSSYFGATITILMFVIASFINKKWQNPFTTPLFLATVFVIAVLLSFNIPYAMYNASAKYLTYFLVPVTVMLSNSVAFAVFAVTDTDGSSVFRLPETASVAVSVILFSANKTLE